MKFAFIAEQEVAFPVGILCRLLGVSTSGFYASKNRLPSTRAVREHELVERVRAAYKASKGRYGSPRVHAELRARGERVSRKRVARLMRQSQLEGRRHRRFRTTTNSKHGFAIAPNIVQRDFTATAPNQTWVTDITAISTRQGWLYLAAIEDLFSRRVIGWATSENIDRHLAITALNKAVQRRNPARGLVHHSDRGSTYASNDYRAALAAKGIQCSMSRKGDCWDNAVAESFFASLKREVIELDRLETRTQGTLIIGDYIDNFYNVQRRHSTIGYRSPVEFELMVGSRRNAV